MSINVTGQHLQTTPTSNHAPEVDVLRFELWQLFGFMTICACLAALSPMIGIASTAALMLMPIALWVRSGTWTLVTFGLALIHAGVPNQTQAYDKELTAMVVVVATAAMLIALVRVPRR